MEDYNKQAEEFLSATGTTLEVILADPQKSPLWAKKGEKHGFNYICTLENARGKYIFDFWASIADRELEEAISDIKSVSFMQDQKHFEAERKLKAKNIHWGKVRSRDGKKAEIEKLKPSAYDVLACLSTLNEDTLEDFCASFGYGDDSLMGYRTFEACKEQDRNLRKLFDMSELEKLNDIS